MDPVITATKVDLYDRLRYILVIVRNVDLNDQQDVNNLGNRNLTGKPVQLPDKPAQLTGKPAQYITGHSKLYDRQL